MNLYLAKSEWVSQGSNYPNPLDLMNVDLFTDYKGIDDKGFTILWHSSGLYWLLFDIDNPHLTDFNRDFKLRQILDNRNSKLNELISI